MPMTSADELLVYANSRNGLGIRILGARRATNKSGIYIKQLLDEGLAQRDGRLKVGDQILSINDETALGISREHAVNLLRSAAATNQVRLRIRHFSPQFSSSEYQKFLYEEKSTDEDEDRHQATPMNNEVKMRRSSRRHRHPPALPSQPAVVLPTYRHSTPNPVVEQTRGDLSSEAEQSLLQSKFRLLDLLELLKKSSPRLFARETNFIEQLTQNHPDGRITLTEFERQSSALLGERVHLLPLFLSSSSRQTIEALETKINICENSQRLANEVELEYEDLLKFLSDQLTELKVNEANQLRHLRANEQLIQKLFTYLSHFVTKPADEQILAQLKFEYEQTNRMKSSSANTKHQS